MPHTKHAWGGSRHAWGRSEFALDVIDRYQWHTRFEGRDVVGTSWPAAEGGWTLTAATAGTVVDGYEVLVGMRLPRRLKGPAIDIGAVYTGSVNFPTTNPLHYRAIFDRPATPFSFRRSYQYNTAGPGGAEYQELIFTDRTQMRADVEGSATPTYTVPNGPTLVDWVIDDTTMHVMINGVLHTQVFNASVVRRPGPGDLFLELPGMNVFHGWRFGQAFTFAEHTNDAAAMGVS